MTFRRKRLAVVVDKLFPFEGPKGELTEIVPERDVRERYE